MYLFVQSGSGWWLSNINEMHSPDGLVLFECYVFLSFSVFSSHRAFENAILFWLWEWGQHVYYFHYYCIYTALARRAFGTNGMGPEVIWASVVAGSGGMTGKKMESHWAAF